MHVFQLQLPRAIIEPTLFSIIVFYIAGLFGGVLDVFQFCVPVIACAIAGTAYGKDRCV